MDPERTGLQRIPAVDALLKEPAIARLGQRLAPGTVVGLIREELDATRRAYLAGDLEPGQLERSALVARVVARAGALASPPLRRVVNATGILLHTNLGRAPLCAGAQRADGGHRRAATATWRRAGAAAREPRATHAAELLRALDRRRGRPGGEQQRRGGLARAARLGRGARGDRLAAASWSRSAAVVPPARTSWRQRGRCCARWAPPTAPASGLPPCDRRAHGHAAEGRTLRTTRSPATPRPCPPATWRSSRGSTGSS